MNTPGNKLYTYDREDESALERRIKEEAGPVKTYKAIEWFIPRRPATDQPLVTVGKTGIRLNAAAARAIGDPEAIRIGWNNLENGLVIAPCKKGEYPSYVLSNIRQVTSSLVMRQLNGRIPEGKHEAELVDGQLLVRAQTNKSRRVGR